MRDAFEPFEELAQALRRGATYAEVRRRFDSARLPTVYRERKLVLFPDDEELWSFLLRVFDYDPRPALERIRVPLLAVFGADDALVPVEASVSVYREAVQPRLLTIAVLPGADHRIHSREPPRLADGYLEMLADFVLGAAPP
jgi:pimeloyl-ACP methyl ester carboxylesterase